MLNINISYYVIMINTCYHLIKLVEILMDSLCFEILPFKHHILHGFLDTEPWQVLWGSTGAPGKAEFPFLFCLQDRAHLPCIQDNYWGTVLFTKRTNRKHELMRPNWKINSLEKDDSNVNPNPFHLLIIVLLREGHGILEARKGILLFTTLKIGRELVC